MRQVAIEILKPIILLGERVIRSPGEVVEVEFDQAKKLLKKGVIRFVGDLRAKEVSILIHQRETR